MALIVLHALAHPAATRIKESKWRISCHATIHSSHCYSQTVGWTANLVCHFNRMVSCVWHLFYVWSFGISIIDWSGLFLKMRLPNSLALLSYYAIVGCIFLVTTVCFAQGKWSFWSLKISFPSKVLLLSLVPERISKPWVHYPGLKMLNWVNFW